MFSTKYLDYIVVTRSRMPRVDRNLFYYPWNVLDDTSGHNKQFSAWLWKKRVKAVDPEKKPKSNHSLPPAVKSGQQPPILIKAHDELPSPHYVDVRAASSLKSTMDSKVIAREEVNETSSTAVEMDPSLKKEDEEHMYKLLPFASLLDVSLWSKEI